MREFKQLLTQAYHNLSEENRGDFFNYNMSFNNQYQYQWVTQSSPPAMDGNYHKNVGMTIGDELVATSTNTITTTYSTPESRERLKYDMFEKKGLIEICRNPYPMEHDVIRLKFTDKGRSVFEMDRL